MSELQKIMSVKKDADAISMFIDELADIGLVLCDRDTPDDAPDHSGYYPTTRSIENILYAYFDIDANKVEQERREILEEARRLNKETNNG